jgi:hypothetical protein
LSNIKPESLLWLDNLAAINAQLEKTPDATHAELGKALNIERTMVTKLSAINTCYDPAAIEKVRLAEKGNPSYTLSFNSAKALAGLKKTKARDLTVFHNALDITLFHRLKPLKIEALVAWIISGKPVSEFDPSAKPAKAAIETTEPEPIESESETEENTQPNKSKKPKNETLGQRAGSGIDKIIGFLAGTQTAGSTKTSGHGSPKSHSAKGKKKAFKLMEKVGAWFAKIAWKELFKIEHRVCRKLAHAIVPLHTSSHSGRSHKNGSFRQGFIILFLTVLHWVVYVLLQYGFLWTVAIILVCPFVPALKPFLEWPFRLAAHFAIYDFPAWVWACAQSHLGPTLFIGALLAIGLYYAWKAAPLRISLLGIGLAYLIIQGRGWACLPSPFSQSATSETPAASPSSPTPMPPYANVLNNLTLAQPKRVSRPVVSTQAPKKEIGVYQPSISFQTTASPSDTTSATTLYDPKLLEQEIAALPQNCIVKSFPVLTDEGMPGDLAVSRMQGVTDPDKYTMNIGSGTEKIISINTTTTNLIINYKSTDPFSILDSAGPLNFFWEDVLYIHTDEIDVEGKTPYKFYQLSLVVSGSKYALTIQCASVDDLKHLVSTMEYFIRNSRLGHDTALAGMPYPSQGLRFNGTENVINLLWAGSPADKAGLKLGDRLWSIGKVANEQQSRGDIEKGLTPSAILYVVSPADWDKALLAKNTGAAKFLSPKMTKVSLPQ